MNPQHKQTNNSTISGNNNNNNNNNTKDNGNDEVSSSAESDEDFGWVSYFLALKGNEFFCEIDEEYIADNFNLTGLANQVPYYEYALDLITDVDHDRGDLSEEHQELVENDAGILYGLIHARYILTNRGLHAMLEKYRQHGFGTCPRYHCNSQAVLPCGITDQKGKASVKLFCPRCEEIYRPPSARHENIDGACFGTTFPHLFFLVFPELKPEKTKEHYVPRAFGFRLHRTWHQRSLEAAQQASQESLQEQEKRKLEILARKNAAEGGGGGGGGEGQPVNANDSNDSDNVPQQQNTKG